MRCDKTKGCSEWSNLRHLKIALLAGVCTFNCADEPPQHLNDDLRGGIELLDAGEYCTDDASTALLTPIPLLVSGYSRVFAPRGTRYLNDHTLVRGHDGRWHVFGIMHTSAGSPQDERTFLHATASDLMGPWREEPDALASMGDEMAIWAPHVVEVSDGHWVMYYFSNAPGGLIRRADSSDLYHWTRTSFSAPGGRDPYLVKHGDVWRLYSVGVGPSSHGRILVSESSDLMRWSPPVTVLEDPLPGFAWGNLESPFVIFRGGFYYLFVTRTSEAHVDYARTVSFVSRDPRRFGWDPIAEYPAHAAEIVNDGRSDWMTSGGWTGYVGERWRGLSTARLAWATCIRP